MRESVGLRQALRQIARTVSPLLLWDLQVLCEALGGLARGALLVSLNLPDADHPHSRPAAPDRPE